MAGGLCAAGAQFPTTAASLYARRFTGTLEHLGTLWAVADLVQVWENKMGGGLYDLVCFPY